MLPNFDSAGPSLESESCSAIFLVEFCTDSCLLLGWETMDSSLSGWAGSSGLISPDISFLEPWDCWESCSSASDASGLTWDSFLGDTLPESWLDAIVCLFRITGLTGLVSI